MAATGAGVVVFAGRMSGYGNMVVVDHGFDLKTVYGHLSAVYTDVGQRVQAGEVVGAVGQTGRATGPHLHYEVRVGTAPVDPLCYLDGRRPLRASARVDHGWIVGLYDRPAPNSPLWGRSSVGRALEWHSRGREFDSLGSTLSSPPFARRYARLAPSQLNHGCPEPALRRP